MAFGISAVMLAALNGVGSLLGISGSGSFLHLGSRWGGWLLLLVLAAGPTLLGYGFYNAALSHLPSAVVNLVATVEPVITAVVAYFYLGERVGLREAIGGSAILAAVLLVRVRRSRRRSR
jgi:drug/metabolite transporter (DMT)-like permease